MRRLRISRLQAVLYSLAAGVVRSRCFAAAVQGEAASPIDLPAQAWRGSGRFVAARHFAA
jgi:hypothetical protein